MGVIIYNPMDLNEIEKIKNKNKVDVLKLKEELNKQKIINQQLGEQVATTKIDMLKLKQELQKGGEK